MSNQTIRFVILLGSVAIFGIIGTQIYWFKQAFNEQEEVFHREVNIALSQTADDIFSLNRSTKPNRNPIKRLSSNYYVVMVNAPLSAQVLETLLINSFDNRNLKVDFEYGIYDCLTECMVYGNYVGAAGNNRASELNTWDQSDYYFGVFFPNRIGYLMNSMGIWSFSSLVLVVVVGFFAYAMFIILKQKRLSEIQKDFVNNMTHEFKTPISTIEIAAEVLSDPEIVKNPARLSNYASIIQNENLRLKNQVERVLQIASTESKGSTLTKEKFDANAIVRAEIESIQTSMPEAQIEIVLKANQGLILFDIAHFKSVIRNLLDNAIKYSPEQPRIEVTTSNEGHQFILDFKDSGIGIDQQSLKHVFDKFYRVPTGNLHDAKGFGLGLFYVKQILDSHQSDIRIESKVGEGTTIKVSISQ